MHNQIRYYSVPGGHIHSNFTCRGGSIGVFTQRISHPELNSLSPTKAAARIGLPLCGHCFPGEAEQVKQQAAAKADDDGYCTQVHVPSEIMAKVARLYRPHGECPACGRDVAISKLGKFRKHKRP